MGKTAVKAKKGLHEGNGVLACLLGAANEKKSASMEVTVMPGGLREHSDCPRNML